MDKRTITRWWIAGVLAMIPGAVLILASALTLAAYLETVTRGNGFNLFFDPYSRTMVALIVSGGIIACAGLIAQFVAWSGAVFNTHRLADRRWFNAVLWCGIVGIVTTPLFGLGALISGSLMIAYLVGGPDSVAAQQPAIPEKVTIKKWSSWAIVAMVAGTFFALLVSNLTNQGRPLQGHLWPSLALLTLGFTVIGAGVVAMIVAWWGALFNTHRLADKTWFNRLLWSGVVATVTSPLFGIGALVGLGVMIAFLRGGPDGLAVQQVQALTPGSSVQQAPTPVL